MLRFPSHAGWLACLFLHAMTLSAEGLKHLQSAAGAAISYEEFGTAASPNCLILLHGASGPAGALYRGEAKLFASHGFHVLMPHYFDATRSQSATQDTYTKWAALVPDFARECRQQPATHKVFLTGYSLGASVALAAGSQGAPVDAIAEWYGSLPDEFFYTMKGMPPLLILHGERDTNIPVTNAQQLVKLCDLKQLRCEHHIYSDQGHGFGGEGLLDAEERTLDFFSQN